MSHPNKKQHSSAAPVPFFVSVFVCVCMRERTLPSKHQEEFLFLPPRENSNNKVDKKENDSSAMMMKPSLVLSLLLCAVAAVKAQNNPNDDPQLTSKMSVHVSRQRMKHKGRRTAAKRRRCIRHAQRRIVLFFNSGPCGRTLAAFSATGSFFRLLRCCIASPPSVADSWTRLFSHRLTHTPTFPPNYQTSPTIHV